MKNATIMVMIALLAAVVSAVFFFREPERIRVALAGNSDAPVTARVPALQIASRLDCKSVLENARELALTGSPLNLRISAIAAVGIIGGEDDLGLLKQILDSSDKHAHKAAAAAMKNIRERTVDAARIRPRGPEKGNERT